MSAPISSAYSAWQSLGIAEDEVITVSLGHRGVRVHVDTRTREGDLEIIGRFLQSPDWYETRTGSDEWVHITATGDVRGYRVELAVLVRPVDGAGDGDTRVPELDVAGVPS